MYVSVKKSSKLTGTMIYIPITAQVVRLLDGSTIDRDASYILTLKAPITTAADNRICDIFPNFRQNKGMILNKNRLLEDDSHEISCHICYF